MRHNKAKNIAWLYMLPTLFLITWILVYPSINAFRWSFFETTYLTIGDFIGLKHYKAIFFTERGIKALFHSVIYVFGSLSLAISLGLLLALALDQAIKLKTMFKVLLIMPWVVSQTIAAMLWGWLYNPSFGIINYLLQGIGMRKIPFLTNPSWGMVSLIIANVWRSYPFAMVMIYAALQTVPKVLCEAAKIDGASRWTMFAHITFPLIRNTLSITIIMLSLLYFNMVTLIFVLTGGGPLGGTETLSYYVFSEAFRHWNIGKSTAGAVVILLLNLMFSFFYIKRVRKEIY